MMTAPQKRIRTNISWAAIAPLTAACVSSSSEKYVRTRSRMPHDASTDVMPIRPESIISVMPGPSTPR